MIDELYPDGIDTVWISSDKNDQVGAFITAGLGPIPLCTLDDSRVSILEIGDYIREYRWFYGMVATRRRYNDW